MWGLKEIFQNNFPYVFHAGWQDAGWVVRNRSVLVQDLTKEKFKFGVIVGLIATFMHIFTYIISPLMFSLFKPKIEKRFSKVVSVVL